MDKLLEQQVRARSAGLCEYCRISTALYDQPFHIDHIIARKHRGKTIADSFLDTSLRTPFLMPDN
jgi:hypothetical protein